MVHEKNAAFVVDIKSICIGFNISLWQQLSID